MAPPHLPACPFMGPISTDHSWVPRLLPADHESQPLKYLPPRIVLSDLELELAARYEKGDFSGGYVASQIAFFRRGPSAEKHQKRREKFQHLKAEVDRRRLVLPEAFIELVESDDYVSRFRHNCIGMQLPDELAPLPSNPKHTLFLIFGEGQGCGYWHLLLAPDGGHVVAFSEHPFGAHWNVYPGGQPDLASFVVYRCADSFSQWIVNFSAESIEADRQYEEMLKRYPGM